MGEGEIHTFFERLPKCRPVSAVRLREIRSNYAPHCYRRLAVERPDIAGDFGLAGEGRHTDAVQQMVEAADRHVHARGVRRRDQDQHTGLQEYV